MPELPPPHRPSRLFRVITLVLAALILGVLAWGLTHRSESPEILGRYGVAYAMLLALLAGIAVILAWSLLRPSAGLTRALVNTYTAVGATLFTLGVVEVGLRVVNPWGIEFFHLLPFHMQGMVDHAELGYVHPRSVSYDLGRNHVSLNSHGLRGEEITLAKPQGERRVLVLGDSVAFGWGVSQGESFSDRMEPILRARTATPWKVVNAGVNGYNSEQEATWLRLYGLGFHPDIVVLVYVDNDVEPVFDPNVTTWRRYPSWPGSLPELLDRMRALSYMFQMAHLMQRARELAPRAGPPVVTNGALRPPRTPTGITTQPGWAESRAALVDIAARCKAAGIPFLVARSTGNDPAFLRELATFGISTIELEPAWQKVPAEQRHVSRVDPHPSAAVHAEMAALLADDLARRGWLGAR